jgi:hypothetical protein
MKTCTRCGAAHLRVVQRIDDTPLAISHAIQRRNENRRTWVLAGLVLALVIVLYLCAWEVASGGWS